MCYVLCAVCCVLCAVCCVLCAVCCVPCAVCCELCTVCRVLLLTHTSLASLSVSHNRKLLWHGTNVSSVAAIMRSGLRIMPSAGGRVGKGLYFAGEIYTSTRTYIIFSVATYLH